MSHTTERPKAKKGAGHKTDVLLPSSNFRAGQNDPTVSYKAIQLVQKLPSSHHAAVTMVKILDELDHIPRNPVEVLFAASGSGSGEYKQWNQHLREYYLSILSGDSSDRQVEMPEQRPPSLKGVSIDHSEIDLTNPVSRLMGWEETVHERDFEERFSSVNLTSLLNLYSPFKEHFSLQGFLEVIGVTEDALHNKIAKEGFTQAEGNVIFHIAMSLTQFAQNIADGNFETAARWLTSPCRSLGNRLPIELLSSSPGYARVQNIIGRIQYGIYRSTSRIKRITEAMDQLTIFRATPREYLSNPFTGIGAALYPGRWNRKGQHMAYTSTSPNLAISP